MKNAFFIGFTFCMFYNICTAQGVNQNLSFQNLINVGTTSPEAASLGKFGNVPVSYSTGIPSISIPIFQVKAGNMSLPVALNYHAGGVRVDETSSSVGTGWALGGIAMVSRNMIGLPDELNGTGFLNSPNPDAVAANPSGYVNYLYNLKNGLADGEPDIFQFNLAGQHGKFIFNRDGTIMQIPLSNNKITFSGEVFTILDENGVKYIFDQGSTSQAISSGGEQYIHMWRLSKMIGANISDTILFKYDATCNQSSEIRKDVSYTIGVTGLSCKQINDGLVSCPFTEHPNGTIGGGEMKTHTQTILHNDSYLNEIDWRGGKIIFTNSCDRQDVSGSGERLRQVDVYAFNNGVYTIVKTVKLYQSYFFSNPTSVAIPDEKNYRLRLDSVSNFPVTASTDKPQTYVLDYDNSPIAPRESGVQDRWGFYNPNGSLMPHQIQLYSSATVPNTGRFYEFGSGTSETDATAMHACTINSIKYPTGGKTVFTMEPHQYHANLPQYATRQYSCNASAALQIPNQPPAQTPFTVDATGSAFYYQVSISAFGTCTTTGGCPSQRPTVTFFDSTTNQTLMTVATPPGSENTSYNTGQLAFNLVPGHRYLITSNIYGATNTNVSINATIGWLYTLPEVDEIKLGGGQRIKNITNYDIDGKFISAEKYDYGTDGTGVSITPQYYQDINFEKVVNLLECYLPATPCGSDWDHFEPDQDINPAFGYSLIYHTNSVLPTSQYCGSPVLYPLVTKYQIDTNGNSNGKTVYNYTVSQDGQQFTNTPVVAPTPLNVPSTGINLISNTWKNGLITGEETHKSTASGYSMIAKKVYAYNTSANNVLGNVLKVKNNYLISSNYVGEQLPSRDFTLSSVPVRTGPVYLQSVTDSIYDDNGNVLTTSINYIYGDLTHFFPTAKQTVNSKGQTITENLKYPHDYVVANNVFDKMVNRNIISPVIQDVKLNNGVQQSLATVNYNDWFSDSKLLEPQSIQQQIRNNSIETRLQFNKYDLYGNIQEQQKTNDVKEVYLWGYNSEYPVAKINNTTYAIANSYITQSVLDNPSDDQTLRSHLDALRNIPGALVTTYTYAPLVGMTSETGPGGKTTFYEYDSFNRLKNIKDYQGNIVKNFQYNYINTCGANCVTLQMQTFTGYNTPSYPVGVFNGAKQFIGMANNPTQYATLWNSNATNQAIGVLSTNTDSLHFNLSLATNAVAPPVVFGLRFYQWVGVSQTSITLSSDSLSFVDWGDGNKELLTQVRAPFYNTSVFYYVRSEVMCYGITRNHTFSNNQLNTITVFHNETTELVNFNVGSNHDDLLHESDIKGFYPEKVKAVAYNNMSNCSDTGVINFNRLTEVLMSQYQMYGSGSTRHNNWQNINNFHKLKWVKVAFKNGLEIMNGNLRNNFPDLNYLEAQEIKPDITTTWTGGGFKNLYVIAIGLQSGSISSTEIDLILNGQATASTEINGTMGFAPVPQRTLASNTSYNTLIARGWNLTQISSP